jgi:hypothetical protein
MKHVAARLVSKDGDETWVYGLHMRTNHQASEWRLLPSNLNETEKPRQSFKIQSRIDCHVSLTIVVLLGILAGRSYGK